MVELFTCTRHPGELRLTATGCAANYRRGKHAEPWDGAYHCRGCEVGARHAGEALAPVVPVQPCRLCRDGAGRKTVYGCLCISCYNRLMEALKGRNAKGRRPRKLAGREVGSMVVVARGAVQFAGRDGRLAWIGRAPGRLPTAQRSLFET